MKLLITGHSSLLAQAIALSRLGMGDEVYMTTRSETTAFDTRVQLIKMNLGDQNFDSLKTFNFDGIILNAMTPTPSLKTFHKAQLEGENLNFLRENIEGNIRLLQALLPQMVEKQFGRIVYVSSMISRHPMAGYSIYGTIKAALEATMRSVAFEYGKHNIIANTLRLGIVATERNRKFREKYQDEMTKNISLKKIATPEQIVEAIHPLLSANCYVQGTEIEVSGGLFIPN